MLRKDWNRYFTPAELSVQLVGEIDEYTPGNIVDICAGSGNLLLAAHTRWPEAKLEGNDLYKDCTTNFSEWSREDGRQFALTKYRQKKYYDLVVANPPFGYYAPSTGRSFMIDSSCHETNALLKSPKMECSMMIASALLVSDRGALAAIVPETMVLGETYLPLREWLGERFNRFKVQRIQRGKFGNEDLGLAFLTAYKKDTNNGCPSDDFVRPWARPKRAFSEIDVLRGRLISSQIGSRGGTIVVHCGGNSSKQGYSLRRCHNSIVKERQQCWVEPGDIVVNRIGKAAGVAGIYDGCRPAVVTDCIYRLKFPDPVIYSKLREKIESGDYNQTAHAISRGLGAKYITKNDLYGSIDLILNGETCDSL